MADPHDTPDPLASDIERIHALRDQGRLTPAEAERLVAVLRGEAPNADDDAVASDVGATAGARAGSSASARTAPTGGADGPTAGAAELAPPSASGPEPASPGDLGAAEGSGARWFVIELLAADLNVTAVAGIDEPRLQRTVEGATLERHGDGWRLRYRSDRGRWGVWGNQPERIDVEIPSELGIELDVKAGDVTLTGVRSVRGRMLAGDLEIEGAAHVDVDKKAGDLTARIRPSSGRQRLVSKAGDLEVTLLPGSDVRVTADVKVGDLHADGPGLQGRRDSHGIGQRYRGTLGAGTAELELRLAAGSLRLRTET
jgi:hypothetical protein